MYVMINIDIGYLIYSAVSRNVHSLLLSTPQILQSVLPSREQGLAEQLVVDTAYDIIDTKILNS